MISTPSGTSYRELNAVLAQVQRTSAALTPVSDAQLLALQARWAAALSARLDQAIEAAAPGQGIEAASDAWRALATDLHTLRTVLDAHEACSSVLAVARRGEYRMLALAAGIASLDTPTAQAEQAGYELRLRMWPPVRADGLPVGACRGGIADSTSQAGSSRSSVPRRRSIVSRRAWQAKDRMLFSGFPEGSKP
jgi:hypothetical protein